MKKLIFLILVLGIVSTANARMVLEIQMGDADTVDIVATAGYLTGDDIYVALIGDSSEVIFSGGTLGVLCPTGPVPVDTQWFGGDARANGMCQAPYDGVWGFIGAIAGGDCPPGVIIEEIGWTLVGTHVTNAYIIGTTDFVTFTTLDQLFVPEPMTLALLGLGGLMLRRRRR